MEIKLEMDEGFRVGWNIEPQDDFEDEDVIHFEKRRTKVVYRKGYRAEGR